MEPKETSCTVDIRTTANKRNALGKRKSVASVSHHETVSESLNSPFYSLCLVTWPWIGSEDGGDLALIQTSLLFICK